MNHQAIADVDMHFVNPIVQKVGKAHVTSVNSCNYTWVSDMF
jgi:hypothetical protein